MDYIYEHYVESFDGLSDEEDYTDETAMMQAVLAVLNFKGLIKVIECSTTTWWGAI